MPHAALARGWGGGDRGRGPGPVTRGHAVRGATPRRAPPLAAALWRPLAAASGAGAERGNTAAGAALVLTPPARPSACLSGARQGTGTFPRSPAVDRDAASRCLAGGVQA